MEKGKKSVSSFDLGFVGRRRNRRRRGKG